MKITKLGHCCLVIEENRLRLITDPGGWTTNQIEQKNIDVVLVTHEHPDHLHIDSLKIVLKNNPNAAIYTNSAVGKILSTQSIAFQLLEHGQDTKIKDMLIEGYGSQHAPIHHSINPVMNTGYLISNKLFYPGDSFINPKKPVEILALPVAGPWLKMSEVAAYAKLVNPKICFPVHDAMIKLTDWLHSITKMILKSDGINFIPLKENESLNL